MMSRSIDRRTFNVAIAASVAGTASAADADETSPTGFTGPMVGHVSSTSATIWFRPELPGDFALLVRNPAGELDFPLVEQATADADLCITWRIEGLSPGQSYQYIIVKDQQPIIHGGEFSFVTAPKDDDKTRVRLAIGSCADTKPLALWDQIEEQQVQGVVLLGDMPYIDSRDLQVARKKHRDFLRIPQLAKLIRHLPTWGTWDDHDFGGNDTDGRMQGKLFTRQAFVEYRANESFGHEDQGVYTKFRYGPVEVFLLDTRWFARTEPSPVDPDKPTLLGKRQWNWLREGLAESTAPFKLIACGMIWDDKENTESDDWGSYTHERTALFDYLGEKDISGVLLIGGDIHCSRWLRYQTEEQVGYPLHQFIVSPIHDRTIPKLNTKHPDLVQGAAIPHVWLKLEIDATQQPAMLHAEWLRMDGRKMWDVKLSEDELRKS